MTNEEIVIAVQRLTDKVDDLCKILKGNGKPGLIDDFYAVKASHNECVAIRKALKEKEASDMNNLYKRVGVIVAVVSFFVQGIIYIINKI
jgi:hypothetical protein